MANLLLNSAPLCVSLSPNFVASNINCFSPFSTKRTTPRNKSHLVKAFLFNPADDPVLKEAIKEPVAFMGGIFAGLLRLDLNEEPLKDWVNRTVEASGITEEDINTQSTNSEGAPQQIDIE